MFNQVFTTDVLVIGSGAAGIRAAIEAYDKGADVTIVDKGYVGRSGATAHQASISDFSAFSASLTSPEEHLTDIIRAGDGLCSTKLARILAYEAPEELIRLQESGIEIHKTERTHVQMSGDFSTRPRMHKIDAGKMLEGLRKQIHERAIQIHQGVTIVDLITEGGVCLGAIGLAEDSEDVIFNARSTILATGGACQVFSLNLVPKGMTGDGYVMALRSGAELINMEFLQMGFGIVHPRYLLLNPFDFWCLHPDLYNAHEESFLEKYLPEETDPARCLDLRSQHFPFSTSQQSKYLDIAIHKEILAGRGTERMGVYVDFRNVPQEALETKAQQKIDWLLSHSIDMRREPLEISIFAHCNNGGVRIDETTETKGVANLFAAGEVAGGPHGADRLGGNMLAACLVFGARAGRFAAEKAKSKQRHLPNIRKTEKNFEWIEKILKRKNGLPVHEISERVENSMWRNSLIVREKSNLNMLSRELKRLEELFHKDASSNSVLDVLSTRNILEVAKAIVAPALAREESRGTHYREDFPQKNDRSYKKVISIKKKNDRLQLDVLTLD